MEAVDAAQPRTDLGRVRMRDFQQASKREVSATGMIAMLVRLLPYVWPADRPDLKGRVIFATALLFAAKFATIAVPFTFKWATDALAGRGTAPVAADKWVDL